MTLSSGVAVGSHTALTFLLAFGNSLTVFALCCGALSIIMATFPKCPASSFRYRSTVSLSNLSYVLMNCLPSVAMEPYATTLPCLPLYVVTMGSPFGDQYFVPDAGSSMNMDSSKTTTAKPLDSRRDMRASLRCAATF